MYCIAANTILYARLFPFVIIGMVDDEAYKSLIYLKTFLISKSSSQYPKKRMKIILTK